VQQASSPDYFHPLRAPSSSLILTTTRVSDCDIATFYVGFNINMSSDDEMSDANSSADMFL